MMIRLLGSIELRTPTAALPVGRSHRGTLLAILARDLGKPVSLDLLAERIWDDEPPANAQSNLHVLVSRLRRRLQEAGGDEAGQPVIVTGARHYTLEAEPEAVDWRHFGRLAAQARSLAESGDDQRALQAYEAADRLWHGEALAGLPGAWAQTARTLMAEQRHSAALARSAVELRLGRFAEAVPDLRARLEQRPADESLGGQLMVALYGCGRQGEALQVFQQLRRRQLETLGAEPGAQLAHTHALVLRQAPIAELIPPADSGPRGAARHRGPSNLPGLSQLIGRGAELSRLTGLDTRAGGLVRIETVCGMGGIGKTLLAVHAADRLRERFPDAQLYLDLRAHNPTQQPLTPEAALAALLRSLLISPSAIPHGLDELRALWRSEMATRRAVVVLDDAAGPEQVRPLLLEPRSPSLVLVTSRHRLVELPGSRALFVDPLPPEDAAALFRQLVGPDRTEDMEDVEQVGDVVARCGLLPLAITLVASRLKGRPTWSLTHLAQRLAREHGRLNEFGDDVDSVRAAFSMSYVSLTPDQQTAFRRFGLHPGPDFGPCDAAALLGSSVQHAERMLESLLYSSLLEEPAAERYRFHDLLGSYAVELADAEDSAAERTQAVHRLVTYALRAADSADRTLHPRRVRLPLPLLDDGEADPRWDDDQQAANWLAESRASLLNIERHAREHGLPEEAAWLSHILAEFLELESYWPEAEPMHAAAAAHWNRTGNRRAEARALISLGLTYCRTSRFPLATSVGERAVVLAQSLDDADGVAEGLTQLGLASWSTGDHERALAHQRDVLEIRELSGNRFDLARSRNSYGISLLLLGRHEEALTELTAALAGMRQGGDTRREAAVLNNLGELHFATGDRKSARQAFEQSLALSSEFFNEVYSATIQINLAKTLDLPEEFPVALKLGRSTLAIWRRLGDQKNEADALCTIGALYAGAGQHDQALPKYLDALHIAQGIGAGSEEILALQGAGEAEAARHHLDRAENYLTEALALAEQLHSPGDAARAQQALVEIRRDRRDSRRA